MTKKDTIYSCVKDAVISTKQKVWLSSGLYQTRPILWSSDLIHLNVEVAYPFIQLVKQIFVSIHL